MSTRMISGPGISILGFTFGNKTSVEAPMAAMLDRKGQPDGFLSPGEIKRASTRDLKMLLGELDGEVRWHSWGTPIPFYDKAKEQGARGAGALVNQELVSRGVKIGRSFEDRPLDGPRDDHYMRGWMHTYRGEQDIFDMSNIDKD